VVCHRCKSHLYIGWRDVITDLHHRQQVAFYGLGLNPSSILTSALLTRAEIGSLVTPSGLASPLGIFESLQNVVMGSLVVCVAGLLPGYYAEVWGRRPIQFLAFAMLTVLLAILGKMTAYQESSEEFVDVPLTACFYLDTQSTKF
jgi:hypothetical protein